MLAIEIDNLTKAYERLVVLRGLNLRVAAGQAYGLLGPNGAGKSTLIHLMLGYLRPNGGSIRILGSTDLEAARSRIGYLPERLRYHVRFAGREYLRYLGRFDDLGGPALEARIDEVLRIVGLQDAADRLLSTYSKGMLQRFGIAQALLSEPELLLIDEPSSGLDPGGQSEMIDLLADLRGAGHTIFMTTHVIDEAERLCDAVGVLVGGQLAAEVDVHALRVPGNHVLITVSTLPEPVIERLHQIGPAVRCEGFRVSIQPNTPAIQARVLRTLLDANVPIVSLDPQTRPLEDFYTRIARGETPELPLDATPVVVADGAPPNGLFAPPGHPDRATAESAPPAPRRPGDTLLRELLNREQPPAESEKE